MVGVQDIDKVIAILKKEDFIQGEVREGELVPATKKEILFSRLNTYEIVPLIKDWMIVIFHFMKWISILNWGMMM